MLEYFIKRFIQIIPVLFLVTLLIVSIVRITPGDPVRTILGEEAGEGQYEELQKELGLDKSILSQYGSYLKGLSQGNMGRSYFLHRPVTEDLGNRYVYTFRLALATVLVSAIFGIIFGVIAALNRGKMIDSIIVTLSLVGLSIPIFFTGMILIIIFGVKLRWLPIVGLTSWKYYILPVISLGTQSIAVITRTTRSAMLEVLCEDYVRTAKAFGLSKRTIIYNNALRNAMIPVITTIGVQFGGLLTGAVVTEKVFSINGIGSYMVNGVLMRDYPVIQGTILMFAIAFVFINLFTDLSYVLFDPRVRRSYK